MSDITVCSLNAYRSSEHFFDLVFETFRLFEEINLINKKRWLTFECSFCWINDEVWWFKVRQKFVRIRSNLTIKCTLFFSPVVWNVFFFGPKHLVPLLVLFRIEVTKKIFFCDTGENRQIRGRYKKNREIYNLNKCSDKST